MTTRIFALHMNMIMMRGVDTRMWYPSGLHCRTLNSTHSF